MLWKPFPLSQADPAAFDGFYALLEQSFPRSERRDAARQQALLRLPAYQLYLCGEAAHPDALAALWTLDGFRYLEHFAVSPSLRGQGLGARLLSELLEMDALPFLLEAEPPESGPLAQRRVAFYERGGLRLDVTPYLQPPLSPGQKWQPLRIMTYPAPLSPEEFDRCRNLLYKEVYFLPKNARIPSL